jgi:hypothetical protein
VAQLDKMVKFLRPGGVLCFEVGLLGGISPIWYKLMGEIGLGQHLWLYSDRALRNLIRKAGLNIHKIKYFGLAPEVILGRIAGIFCNRVIRPTLAIATPLRILPPPNAAQRLEQYTLNFLRYKVGSVAPRVGPQTLFVVVEPKQYAIS